jgi:predicted DCC family thiol-disulfide oxidoreductase YuxK
MTEQAFNKNQRVIFFDGYCNLCNGAVQWIIAKDRQELFEFAPINSQFAIDNLPQQLLTNVDSIVLLDGSDIYVKSSAALQIAKLLPLPIHLLSVFRVIPPTLRDGIYDLIAKYRYRIWGQRDSCMIPTPELKSRFKN